MKKLTAKKLATYLNHELKYEEFQKLHDYLDRSYKDFTKWVIDNE